MSLSTRAHATAGHLVGGHGDFLIRRLNWADMFTREDLTDEQRMFGRTAAEFMRYEVLPNQVSLYAHDWDKTRELRKSAAKPRSMVERTTDHA